MASCTWSSRIVSLKTKRPPCGGLCVRCPATSVVVTFVVVVIVMMLGRDVVALVLDDLGELFTVHLLFGLRRLLADEIDNLVLEHRCTQTRKRLRVLAVIVVDLLLLAWEATDFGDQRLLVLVLGHLDLVLVADLGDHQAQAHAALGDLAILLAGFGFGRAFVLERAAVILHLMLDALPDRVALCFVVL